MDDIDSLQLALMAEKHNHRKDNEYLLARIREYEATLWQIASSPRETKARKMEIARQFLERGRHA